MSSRRFLNDRSSNVSLPGVYDGVVERTIDPLRLGRCKIRIPVLHGTQESMQTDELPWAWPLLQGGGGIPDTGSHMVPAVGATVYVIFQRGNTTKPLYLGGWYKNPNERRDINTRVDPNTGEIFPQNYQISEGTWEADIGPEAPLEVQMTPGDPTMRLLYKSQKGATFAVQDWDAFEETHIIDRAGQVFSMRGPVDGIFNSGNSEQRGLRSARDGNAIDYDTLSGKAAIVELLGTTGQGLRILSSPNGEFVELVSNDPEDINSFQLYMGGGTGILTIVGRRDGEEEIRIEMNTFTGDVRVEAKRVSVEAEEVSVRADDVRVQGNVTVEGDLTVRGQVVSN